MSVYSVLFFAVVLAFAAVRGFVRLSPSIEQISERNAKSIYLTSKMMETMSLDEDIELFRGAFLAEKNNVTEPAERELITEIEYYYEQAFAGDKAKKKTVLADIAGLAEINRLAIKESAVNMSRLSSAGAWVIFFLAAAIISAGLVLIRKIDVRIIKPLNELNEVFADQIKGNKLRRCPKVAPSVDFQKTYDNVNSILDRQ